VFLQERADEGHWGVHQLAHGSGVQPPPLIRALRLGCVLILLSNCSVQLQTFRTSHGSHTLSPRPRAKRKKKEQFAEDEAALKKKEDTEAERKAEAIALASAQATPRNRIAYAATPLRDVSFLSSAF